MQAQAGPRRILEVGQERARRGVGPGIARVAQRIAQNVRALRGDLPGRQERAVHRDLGRLLGDVELPERDRQVLQLRRDQVEIVVDAESLDGESLRVHQLVARAEREVPVTRVDLALRAVEDEKPVSLNRQVRRAAGVGDAAFAEVGLDGGDLRAQADLLRVGAAVGGRRGRPDRQRLRELRREENIGRFEAVGVGVGDVVADDGDGRLVERQSVDGRVQRRCQTHRFPPSRIARIACRTRPDRGRKSARLQSARAATARSLFHWLSAGRPINPNLDARQNLLYRQRRPRRAGFAPSCPRVGKLLEFGQFVTFPSRRAAVGQLHPPLY